MLSLKGNYYFIEINCKKESMNVIWLQAIKDTTIIALVPQLRETIAQLVYKVKAALAANNCSSGFWAGNLKNKDLNGDEILSQVISNFRRQLHFVGIKWKFFL